MNQEIYDKCSQICNELTEVYHDYKEHTFNVFTYNDVKEYVRNHTEPHQLQMCSIIVYGMLKLRYDSINNTECGMERYCMFAKNKIELRLSLKKMSSSIIK